MSGGVGRFARKKPQESAASEKTSGPTGGFKNNDAPPPPAPECPGAFASFDDRPATSGSHGFTSIGMYAVDDDEAMNGFSDLNGTDTFGMHDGGDIGGDLGAFAMEDDAMELGAMDQDNNGVNATDLTMTPNPSGAGLSMFKKKTAAACAPARNESAAPQKYATNGDVSPPEALYVTNGSVTNLGNVEIVSESADRGELTDKNDNVSPHAAVREASVFAATEDQHDPLAAKVPESISGDGEDDVQDDLTATSYYSARENVVMDIAVECQDKMHDVEVSSAGEVEGVSELGGGISDATNEMTRPKDMVAPDAVAAADTQKLQASFRPMTAPRVSLSPPPNVTNRNGKNGISPLRNTMTSPSNISFANSNASPNQYTKETSFAHGSFDAPHNHKAEVPSLQNIGLANVTNVNSNQYTEKTSTDGSAEGLANDSIAMDNHMDDDNSIVIPGFTDLVATQATNDAYAETTVPPEFGTDVFNGFSINDLDTSMDLSLPLEDVTMNEADASDAACTGISDSSVTHSRPRGFNSNFSGIQTTGSTATKSSFLGRTGGALVNRSASDRIGTLKAQTHLNAQHSRHNSFVQSSQKSKSSADVGSFKDRQSGSSNMNSANLPLVGLRNSTTITPPNRGRNARPNTTTLYAPTNNNSKQYNNAVTPDTNAQNSVRPAIQKQSGVDRSNESAVDRMMTGHESTYSPPASTEDSDSTTPKMSNVQLQPPTENKTTSKNAQWNLSNFAEISCSNLSFDELLNHFIEDIQEANDLHERGENELLELEVDLSHAMSAALRYKGDMMDLLHEIEVVQATAERMLAQFSK